MDSGSADYKTSNPRHHLDSGSAECRAEEKSQSFLLKISSLCYSFLAEQTGKKTCPGIEEEGKEIKQSQGSGKQEDGKGKTIYN